MIFSRRKSKHETAKSKEAIKIEITDRYDNIEPVEIPKLDIEKVKMLSAEDARNKVIEYKELKTRNHEIMTEINTYKETLLDRTEEEYNARNRLNEKIERFKNAESELESQLRAFEIQYSAKRGCRINEKSLKEYAAEETSFWKFSQSIEGIAGEDGVYAAYEPGLLVESMDKDMMLSFVRAEDLYKCWQYGDQITKFKFDIEDEGFKKIADCPAYETGNWFGEIKTDYLIPESNYSLANYETLVIIIQNSGKNITDAVNKLIISSSFKERMKKYGFFETVSFIEYIKEQANKTYNREEWIAQNIQQLCEGFREA